MNKLRKGSIAWDVVWKDKVKILTSPGKGELTDSLFKNTGKRYNRRVFGHIVLVKVTPNIPFSPTCNNVPCRYRAIANLIPYSDHVKDQNLITKHYERYN
jgi:hypothetical protein